MIILAILFTLLGILIFPGSVYAEFTFATSQTTITPDQDIDTSVTLSLQGQNNKTYYLEGAFKKEGSSNYFGLTWNNSSWVPYTASNFTILKSITTDQTGKWNGVVKVKIDQESSLFSDNVAYTLRLKRFTTNGSYSWAENSITITVNSSPSPTPSPSPSPSPTSTPTPAPTPKPTSSFTISNIPTQINSDQSFSVSIDLALPNNNNSAYYLSGAFKKVDGIRYFGLTKINSNWVPYNSSNYLNQYKITTDDSGRWTGTLEVKPDTEDSDYKGSGDYIFKVARYSSSSTSTWSSESTIKIISAENNQDEISANIPSSTTTPLQVKTSAPSPTKNYERLAYRIASVAAATASAKTATPEASIKVKNQKQINLIIWVGLIFVFAGAGSIGYIYLKSNGKIPFKF